MEYSLITVREGGGVILLSVVTVDSAPRLFDVDSPKFDTKSPISRFVRHIDRRCFDQPGRPNRGGPLLPWQRNLD